MKIGNIIREKIRGTKQLPGFDPIYYQFWYPDVRASGQDPLKHYLDHGWREGRDPSAGFSTSGYLTANPDVAQEQINPLVHFVSRGFAEGRSGFAKSPLASPPKPGIDRSSMKLLPSPTSHAEAQTAALDESQRSVVIEDKAYAPAQETPSAREYKDSIVISMNDPSINTMAGQKIDGVLKIETPGVSSDRSYALFGPYMKLGRGKYRADFKVRLERARSGPVVVDVVCDKGASRIAASEFDAYTGIRSGMLRLNFELQTDATDVEFRIDVPGGGLQFDIEYILINPL